MKSSKETYINLAILIALACVSIGMFAEIAALAPLGFLFLGLILTVFHREVAEERFRIDKASKNEFLKKHLFASETVERNRFVVLVLGIVFLAVGIFILAVTYLSSQSMKGLVAQTHFEETSITSFSS